MSLIVVCYDIPDRRRRARVASLIEGYGDRVQKSVFECELDPQRERALYAALLGLIDRTEDKLVLYPQCGKDHALSLAWDKRGVAGRGGTWVV